MATQIEIIKSILSSLKKGKVETETTLDRIAAAAAMIREHFKDTGKAFKMIAEQAANAGVELDESKIATLQTLARPDADAILSEAKTIAKEDNRRVNARILVNDIGEHVANGLDLPNAGKVVRAKRQGKSDAAVKVAKAESAMKQAVKAMGAVVSEAAEVMEKDTFAADHATREAAFTDLSEMLARMKEALADAKRL